MKKNKLIIIELIINILIIILEIIGFTQGIKDMGLSTLKYYTQDSNLLLLISSCIITYYLIKRKDTIPQFWKWFRFTSIVSITLTLIVVITILSWMMPGGLKGMLLEGMFLYHHTLCPILGLFSFIFLEKYDIRNNKQIIRTIYFTFIYALTLIILNILKIVDGPYPFLKVYNQPLIISIVWFILIIGGTFFIATLLKIGNKKLSLTRKK